ncbi:MAG TPA: hypothetical protein VE999_09865 [Gemmataceae bacterium]|nr:hypothetical protein [Gemmataceae bacterium]
MVFAREVTDSLTSLVKKIDEATQKNSDARMGSFVVFCSDEEGLKKKLEDLADKEKLKKTILTIDNPAGPEGYDIAKDADVTVLLYVGQQVKVNHAYKKGELSGSEVDKILSELPKILEK